MIMIPLLLMMIQSMVVVCNIFGTILLHSLALLACKIELEILQD